MTRHLIVANQTLGGAKLERELKQRIEQGNARFYVVVPMVQPELEASNWVPHDPMFGMPAPAGPEQDAIEEARKRSQHRLNAILTKVDELGGDVQGEVGDSDPAKAVANVLERESFSEVIVSTLPSGISRWIKMDLPSRVERMAECPVTTIEADPEQGE